MLEDIPTNFSSNLKNHSLSTNSLSKSRLGITQFRKFLLQNTKIPFQQIANFLL